MTSKPDHNAAWPSDGIAGEPYAHEIVARAVSALGEDFAVSLTLAREGGPATVASSDARAAELDRVQYGLPGGPCLTAIRTGQSVLVSDLTATGPGGSLRDRAFALGVRSVLSVPLEAGSLQVGSLNLYARYAYGIGSFEVARAVQLAEFASRTLSLGVRLAEQVEMTAELREALRSRTLIDQAVGIIMSQRSCDAETAMAVLSAASLDQDVALAVRAAQIRTAAVAPLPTNGHRPAPQA